MIKHPYTMRIKTGCANVKPIQYAGEGGQLTSLIKMLE